MIPKLTANINPTAYPVALVRQGDNVTVYLNGQVEIATTAMPLRPGSKWTDGTWAFGGRSDIPSIQKYFGNLDEIALFNGALSQTAIQAHYQVTIVPELSIQRRQSNLELSWPAAAVGYSLESTLNLRPADWMPVNATPVGEGGINKVMIQPNASSGFFRLRR